MASNSLFVRWYRNRIGEPATSDEASGYWIFAVGVILGIVGIYLFLASIPAGQIRQWSIVIAALGLLLILAGPLIRLPLRRSATYLVYLGTIIGLGAIVWFIMIFPAGWNPRSGQSRVIALYAGGLLVMAIGGILVPLLTSSPERDEEMEALSRERDDFRDAVRDTEADEADLAARLRALHKSQARFELYQDSQNQHRWRLRHRNGNIIADSGEGYTRRHNAQKGLQSVRRNALGATVLIYEDEAELPAEEESFEPFVEVASQAHFELYEDEAGEFRWGLIHENGNVLADSSEGYRRRQGAADAIENLQSYVGPADYLRIDPTAFEIYRDEAGEYRWRLVHRNGNILADSAEGYSRRQGARTAIDRIQTGLDELEFEIYEDTAGEHRWRLRAANNQIMADSGEGYASRSGVEDAVERVEEYAPSADVLDAGPAAFEIYEDSAGEYRWRLRHRNGNIIADGGEGYSDRSGARDGIESVKRNAPNTEVRSE